jgi:hypothetical protein
MCVNPCVLFVCVKNPVRKSLVNKICADFQYAVDLFLLPKKLDKTLPCVANNMFTKELKRIITEKLFSILYKF